MLKLLILFPEKIYAVVGALSQLVLAGKKGKINLVTSVAKN